MVPLEEFLAMARGENLFVSVARSFDLAATFEISETAAELLLFMFGYSQDMSWSRRHSLLAKFHFAANLSKQRQLCLVNFVNLDAPFLFFTVETP